MSAEQVAARRAMVEAPGSALRATAVASRRSWGLPERIVNDPRVRVGV